MMGEFVCFDKKNCYNMYGKKNLMLYLEIVIEIKTYVLR